MPIEVTGTVVVTRKGLRQARRGLPRIEQQDVLRYDGDGGAFADIVDDTGLPSGTGVYDPFSTAPIRLLSSASTRDPVALLQTRLERALARRAADVEQRDAFRLCNGEADGVPGLVVDRFGGGLLLTMELGAMEPVLQELMPFLEEKTGAGTVVLARRDGVELVRGPHSKVRFVHGRLSLAVDLASPAAQRMTADLERQRHLKRWARGRCLDLAAGACGYGLQLGDAGAAEVVCVDEPPHLSTTVGDDAQHNQLTMGLRRVESDPVAWLRSEGNRGGRCDVLVFHPRTQTDPPPVATARATEYGQLCLKLLDEGGILAISSPSEGFSDDAFTSALQDAAVMTRKRLQMVARLGLGPDHPTLAGVSLPTSLMVMRVLKSA